MQGGENDNGCGKVVEKLTRQNTLPSFFLISNKDVILDAAQEF